MNERFFSLPEEKQLAIINGGYRVFSQNSYRKSPMSEIAAEGYLWEKTQQGQLNADEVEKDFIKMIDFWKQIYLRKE
ncbi:MAG: hypothetical protein ACI4KB_10640 [Oscillospiraceae bacterium]